MAEAGKKTITTWLTLREKCELIAKPFGPTLARELLVQRLREGTLRSRGFSENGVLTDIPSKFWGRRPIIDWQESGAHTRYLSPPDRFYRIEVSHDDTETLPSTTAASVGKVFRRGREPTYDHDAIRQAANDVLESGLPDLKSIFYEKLCELLHKRHIKIPSDRQLRRTAGPIYDSRKNGTKA